jgi:hypothetical protein
MIFLWASFICIYVAYVFGPGAAGLGIDCDSAKISAFGCQIVNAILGWLSIMAQLIILGGTFFMVSSFGNTIFLSRGLFSVLKVVVSMAMIFFCCIWFYYDEGIDTWLFTTSTDNQSAIFIFFYGMAYVIGVILLILQAHTLVRLLIPPCFVEGKERLQRWLLPGAVPKETRTKRAAAFKTNRMVENALSLHLSKSELSNHKNLRSSTYMSGNAHAMTTFLSKSHERQTVGGLLWGWRQFLTSRICYEEGVFFHARLIASCVAQLLLILVIGAVVFIAFYTVNDVYRNAEARSVGIDAQHSFGECTGYDCDVVLACERLDCTIVSGEIWQNITNITSEAFENATDFDYWLNATSWEEYYEYQIRSSINDTLNEALSGTGVEVTDAMVEAVYVGLQDDLENLSGLDVVAVYSAYSSAISGDVESSGEDWLVENVEESA